MSRRSLIAPLDRSVTLRFSSEDYTYLYCLAHVAGMTVSQYLRVLAQASITAAKVAEQKGDVNFEDLKALLND